MAVKFGNNATSTLAGAINNAVGAIAINVGDADKFPVAGGSDWFPLTLIDSAGNMEILRCVQRVGTTLTVWRGQEGTTQKAFPAGAKVELRLTAAALTDILGNLNAKANLTGATFTGGVAAPFIAVDVNGDRVVQFRTATGVTRGMVRHDQAANAMIISTFDPAGAWYRDLVVGGASGVMSYGGNLVLGGGATFQTDGNILFSAGMAGLGHSLHSVLGDKVTTDYGRAGSARYVKQGAAAGGVDMQFNWNGQGGQPSWMWGGNDGQQMFVYNPSNFNVNYAASAGYANSAGGSGSVGGWSIDDIKNHIEARAAAFANDRINNLQFRKVGQTQVTPPSNNYSLCPAGAVMTGFSGSQGHYFFYHTLQAYDQVRGWVSFSG